MVQHGSKEVRAKESNAAAKARSKKRRARRQPTTKKVREAAIVVEPHPKKPKLTDEEVEVVWDSQKSYGRTALRRDLVPANFADFPTPKCTRYSVGFFFNAKPGFVFK